MKRILVLLSLLLNFSAHAGMESYLPPDFSERNPELNSRLLKAQELCTQRSAFNEEMITFVEDPLIKRVDHFYGSRAFFHVSRLPSQLVRYSVSGVQAVSKMAYQWSSGNDSRDSGDEALAGLIQMMKDTQSEYQLSQPESACMAACVTRVLVKYGFSLSSLMAPAKKAICSSKGLCSEFAQVFETLSNEVGVTAYSFFGQAGFHKALALGVNSSLSLYFRQWLVPSVIEVSPIMRKVMGHYLVLVELDGKTYFFDPMSDYSAHSYTCRFHPRESFF